MYSFLNKADIAYLQSLVSVVHGINGWPTKISDYAPLKMLFEPIDRQRNASVAHLEMFNQN